MRRPFPLLFAALPAALATTAVFAGCGSDGSEFPPGATSSGSVAPSGSSGAPLLPGSSGGGSSSGVGVGPGCGNTFLETGEACDDGNAVSGDGCSDTCAVEAGFTCSRAGAACVALCGDGLLRGDEDCDDGNTRNADGCSDGCRLEEGFKCTSPGDPCEATTCGDGVVEGTEQCDDLVTADVPDRPYDGCYRCVKEPSCNGQGCTGACGDGLLFPNEACDDGNVRDGDGCSRTCTLEPGFQCEVRTEELPEQLVLPAVYRDFESIDGANGHPDFEFFKGVGAYRDLVRAELGSDGKPVFNKTSAAPEPCVLSNQQDPRCTAEIPQLTSEADFNEWYHDGPRGRAVVSDLTLQGQNGVYVFDSKLPPFGEVEYVVGGQTRRAGIFFPLDPQFHGGQEVGWGRQLGNSCRNFSTNAPSSAPCADPAGTIHNFHFTTELRFRFTYQDPGDDTGGPLLNFTGDDDVWIFMNGKRVVDMGGLHSIMGDVPAHGGTVVLNRAKAAELGLVDQHVYEIAVFHAERRTDASNFKLTLGGFLRRRTFCESQCGDGVKTKDETCDDGILAGGYNQCAAGCVWGPRCGDGIVQTQFGEECDDANFQSQDGCRPDCILGDTIN